MASWPSAYSCKHLGGSVGLIYPLPHVPDPRWDSTNMDFGFKALFCAEKMLGQYVFQH